MSIPLPPASSRSTPRFRAILVLTGTLLLGIVLGVLLTGYIVRQRFAVLELMREESGFVQIVEDAVEPTPEQQEAIRPILRDAREGMIDNLTTMRSRMAAHIDSTLERLDPHLDDEQMARARDVLRVRPGPVLRSRMPEEFREPTP